MERIRYGNCQLEMNAFFSLNAYSTIHVLADENTVQACYPKIQDCLPKHQLIQISSGERNKNLETASFIWNQLLHQSADRNSLLICLGGGVIGDMGGFCASVFKRGMDYILIPTTLLAQVDASIGGKTAVDFQETKNVIGCFSEAQQVFIDTDFLNSLDIRQRTNGVAEMLKHGLIADEAHFQRVSALHPNEIPSLELVQESIHIKQKLVASDFREGSVRKLLNFGHSIGHAIESIFMNSSDFLLHGEAIAIGMICEAWLSVKKNMLDAESFQRIQDQLKHFFPMRNLSSFTDTELLHYLSQDKKNRNGQFYFVLLNNIGAALYDVPVSQEEVLEAIRYYQSIKSI